MMPHWRWNWTAAAWLLWGAFALVIAIHGFYHPRSHTVYDIYCDAARNWWAGQDMYVPAREHYRYSPLFAVSVTPFAALPDGLGNALWKIFNIAVFAGGLYVWSRQVLPVFLTGPQVAGLFLLALPLSFHSMYNGQANLLMLGLLLAGLAAAADGRWNRAAVFLAGATLIKGYPLALALILAGLYPRRFAPRFAAALALGLALPFAAQWPATAAAQYASWYHHLRDSTEIMRERLRSLDYLFVITGRPLSARIFSLLELAAGAVVFLLSWLQVRQTADPRERFTRIGMLFLAWVALFGPATESCTYVVLAPALGWAVVEAYRRPARHLTGVLLVASLVMAGPLVTDLFGPAVRNFANGHGSQPLGALLFLAYLLARTGRPYAPALASPESGQVESWKSAA